MRKKIGMIYFAVLFLMMAAYIYQSIPDDQIRFQVISANELSYFQRNVVYFRASNLGVNPSMEGYSVNSQWVSHNFAPVEGGETVRADLPKNGEIILEIPDVPDAPVAALQFNLVAPNGETIKTALVNADVFQGDAKVVTASVNAPAADQLSAYAYASFLQDSPNALDIIAFEGEKPYLGIIQLEQRYGNPAKFPARVDADPSGITTVNVSIQSATEFKITAGKQVMYPGFVMFEKPFWASIDSFRMTPEHKPSIHLVPVGKPSTVYLDYFDNDAWIGRRVLPPETRWPVTVDPVYRFSDRPQLLYIRVSLSSYGDAATSQIFPVVTSSAPLDPGVAARFAMDRLDEFRSSHPEYALMKIESTDSRSPEILNRVCDEALKMLSIHHDPQRAIRVSTEKADALAYDTQKTKFKSVMNILLIAWFGLGIILCAAVLIPEYRQRRAYWREVIETGQADVDSVPPQVSPAIFLILVILMLGLCMSIYYMMQLI